MDVLRLPRVFPALDRLLPDPEFRTMTPETPLALEAAFSRIAASGTGGDYFEFGLYRGYTLWTATRLGDRLPMRFFGFDSFEGLPEPSGMDDDGSFSAGDYAASLEEVHRHLARRGVDWSRVSLTEGWFDRSLTPERREVLEAGPVAIALIDCDLYRSTVPVLSFLDPLLREGSIMLFDDWNCFGGDDGRGQRLAFREYQAGSRFAAEEWISFGWHGQAFIMHDEDR